MSARTVTTPHPAGGGLRRLAGEQLGRLGRAFRARGPGTEAAVCRSYAEATEKNFVALTALLERAGISYWVVEDEHLTRTQVGVREQDREQLLEALLTDGTPGLTVSAAASGSGTGLEHEARRTRPGRVLRYRLMTAPTWYCFTSYRVGGGPVVLRGECAATVSFWRRPTRPVTRSGEGAAPVRAPVLLSATANAVTRVLTDDDVAPAPVEFAGRDYPSIEAFTGPPRYDAVEFPIDVVYLWVDGTDPRWQARRDATWRALHNDHPGDDVNVARHLYENRDEIRYSLRSLEMFAPFVRRVFLVTDDQVPDWLDDSHPQLRVVSHRELFDADDVPTFNSNAIDSRLHHIDGLAEHFLYTNDDIFFTAPAYPVDFFLGNGLARLFLSRATIPHGDVDPGEPNVDSCAKNQRRLLAERFGQTVTQKFKHIPVPQLRSARFEAEEMFSEVAARTAGNRFRHHTDVNYSHLSAYVAYFTGRAITGTLPYDYVYLVDAPRVNALSDIAQAVKVLCLNDGDAASARDSRGRPITLSAADEQGRDAALRAFLEATYPRPSRFERREDEPSPLVLAPRSPADESAVQAPSRGTRQSLGGG